MRPGVTSRTRKKQVCPCLNLCAAPTCSCVFVCKNLIKRRAGGGNPQQQKEVRHPPARAQQHVHPRGARPVFRCLSPAATLVCLTALPMSMQPAPPNLPSTFPTHVDWFMYASMSGSLVPTRTNDAPRHPTARMQHQTSPPAQLDGTGLLQMPPQRAKSPAAKQDNCTNWKHMRTTRSQQRQYEPNETPRLNATHTHQRGNNSAALIAQHLPASLPQAPTTSEHHRPARTKKIPKGRSLGGYLDVLEACAHV